MRKRIFVCAGEASGDLHAAEMLGGLRELGADFEACGVGGPAMEAKGFETLVSIREFGQAGLVEVLRHLPRLRRLHERIVAEIERRRPDAVVLVDFPDFNLRLAKRIRPFGLRTVYFVSPQLWAWRKGRIRTIRETVDRMLVLFRFEEEFYRANGVAATWVGHPIVDSLADLRSGGARVVPGEAPTVALMPGSRRGEVRSLLPTFVEAAGRLSRRIPETRFLLIESPVLDRSVYREADSLPGLERVPPDQRWERIRSCHGAWVASGTATLELALLGIPMIVGYRLHPVSWALARLLVDVPHVALVNLVADERIVPERIQGELSPDRLAEELAPLLVEGEARRRTLEDLGHAVTALGPPGAGKRAARALLEVLA
jgi:lipid-A-disaccharide synthase